LHLSLVDTLSVESLKGIQLGKALAFRANIELSGKGLPGTIILAEKS